MPTTPPPSKRPVSTTLARGPTARSAASPRLPSQNPSNHRRSASRQGHPPLPIGTHEALAASLKQETDEKERLLVQLQDNEQLLNNYVTENGSLISALSSAESRLNEFFAEQSRWELELAQRLDITEKLREQVREIEREKRDLQRRYNEQTASFEAERQAFYDNEQHLKSRIQTLSQAARRRKDSFTRSNEQNPEPDGQEEDRPSTPSDDGPERIHQDYNDPESEPAEMTALELELSTLSTSYASLQSTLVLIQTQLVDLKRVNQELQEENESCLMLVREKTLNGQFDVARQVGSISSEDDGSDDDLDRKSTDIDSTQSRTRSTLDIVQEEPFDGMDSEVLGGTSDSDRSHHISRRAERRRTSSSHTHHGESLAGLPITGPGLDLAAELGRAENKDILAGTPIDDGDRHTPGKLKRSKKDGLKLPQSDSTNLDNVEALRTEVKSLKDANKALSLYASKIIDRIIAQEGFEHILAVDYEKEPSTPSTAVPHANISKSLPFSQSALKPRPQSTIFAKAPEIKSPSPPSMANSKAQRRSLSFDWKSFSLFNTEKKPDSTPNLRPLTLTPGATSVTSARKLDNLEDDEDRRERERLHATMKLLGMHPPVLGAPMERASSAPSVSKNNRRFSLFNSKTLVNESETSSLQSTSSSARYDSTGPSGLTQESLRLAEAEQSLAVLDARERDLRAEIAKGGSGGFTEITPKSGRDRRSRRSGGGSSEGTVWSAGMSGTAED